MPSDVNILLNGDGWVSFVYPDQSRKVFRTTLNQNLLKSLGITQGSSTLYDLDREEHVKIPKNVVTYISKDKPKFDRSVDEFVNRFI